MLRRKSSSETVTPHKAYHLRRSTRYLVVALLPLLLCWLLFINQSRQWAMTITEQNATNNLEKNAMLISRRFSGLQESLYALSNDAAFNTLLASTTYADPLNYYANTETIPTILSQYFWDFDSFCSFYIVSTNFSDCYYNQSGLPNIIRPEDIAVLDELITTKRNATWFPSMRYGDLIRISDRYSKYYADGEVISLGMRMDLSYVYNGIWHRNAGVDDQPVMLISLYTSMFNQWLNSEHFLSDTSYRIYTRDFQPVYASDGLTWEDTDAALLPVPQGKEVVSMFLDGGIQSTFVCSRALAETNWIITSYTPVENAFLYFGSSISLVSLVVILVSVIMVMVVVRVTMRSISDPLTLLCEGLDQTAGGNYSHRIVNLNFVHYQSAFHAYNSMNEHIDKLVVENYETKLSEKELEIQLLNLQFNPHFLYNMLNTISLMALEKEQDDVSDMLCKLAYMMRYSVKTSSPMVQLNEDMCYIEAYIAAMQLRTKSNFRYNLQIDPALMHCLVPKFMLQPFVENAILHGFSPTQQGYELLITGKVVEDDLIFTVEDNGKGMDSHVVETLWRKDSTGIGIANTHKRIHLYYGTQYGVSIITEPMVGTKVTIRIPRQSKTADIS